MKAAFIVAPRKFEIRDIPMPPMDDNKILVKIAACGVCSSDMSAYKDSLSEEMKKRNPFPRRSGHEPAGTVVEVGKNVKGFKVGDRITGYFADGCYAEYVSCDPTDPLPRGHGYIIEKIPDGIPFEYALGEPLMSLVSIARTTTPELGDYVFQVGCGFMGLGVIAGVASPKIREYIACDLDDNRLKLAKELGATITLNPNKVDVVQEVMKITGGRGVDVAIEVVGHPIGIKLTGQVLKNNRGKLILVGWHQAPDTYELFSWIKSPIIYSPQGIGMSTNYKSELERAMWALQKGIYPMHKLVTHKYKLEDIGKAFEDNLNMAPGYIKGVIMME
ncbi:MAG: alcohol dehydrogenase catalytic domain-containing protein [Dehalococcoidales bacterium]|jgi:L-iditol 2-dehydrogenase|nr:alcohol dehydrogenase catalytic domain-containing protein [Dehalococcoidales bacterium]